MSKIINVSSKQYERHRSAMKFQRNCTPPFIMAVWIGIFLAAIPGSGASTPPTDREVAALNKIWHNSCRYGDVCGGMGYPDDYLEDSPATAFKPNPRYTFWTNGVLHYEFNTSTGGAYDQNLFDEAVYEIQNKTCLKVLPRNGNASIISYMIINAVNDTGGCYTYLGMDKLGPMIMSLQPYTGGGDCWYKGIIIHELLHAFGFNHEHQRFDRDDYLYVNFSNIQPGFETQFTIIYLNQSTYYNETYDFDSILHYHTTAFGKIDENGMFLQTMYPLPIGSNRTIVHPVYRPYLSPVDVTRIQNVYGSICPSSSTSTTAATTTQLTTALPTSAPASPSTTPQVTTALPSSTPASSATSSVPVSATSQSSSKSTSTTITPGKRNVFLTWTRFLFRFLWQQS